MLRASWKCSFGFCYDVTLRRKPSSPKSRATMPQSSPETRQSSPKLQEARYGKMDLWRLNCKFQVSGASDLVETLTWFIQA